MVATSRRDLYIDRHAQIGIRHSQEGASHRHHLGDDGTDGDRNEIVAAAVRPVGRIESDPARTWHKNLSHAWVMPATLADPSGVSRSDLIRPDAAFVRPLEAVIKVRMVSSPSTSTSYSVSAIHPDNREFHGENCATLEEAQRRAKELRKAGYSSVTIAPAR